MEQIRHKLIAFEGQAKPSKVTSVMKWWSKCISMVIAKTASSRNVALKAARLGYSIFDRQSEILMMEDVTVNSPSHEKDLTTYVTMRIYMLPNRTRFRARVEAVTSDHNNRMIR